MNLNELTIEQAAQGLRQKKFSAAELTESCLAAIRQKDGDLHAYLDVFEGDALLQARQRDGMIHESVTLPFLCGIPVAVKDNILVKGKHATAGSKMLASYTASYDATAVKKLKARGAIILGKTNLDEFAMGSSTEYSAFGPTRNPRDSSRVPGGSSGGSAAAVAANLCIAALGSDTGGSIRQPASFCGIVGFKPSYSRISRHGLIAMASSLDHIGPLAKNVRDARLLFEAIEGCDSFDSTAIPGRRRDTGEGDRGLKEVKIGVPKEYFSEGLDPEVEKAVRSALKKIEYAGALIKEVSLPESRYALAAYYVIVPSEISANLARYDGIRYGWQSPRAQNLLQTYMRSRAEGFGTEVKRRIMLGTYALSAGYYDAYYLKAQKVRRLITEDFERVLEDVDIIAGPTTPTAAFRPGEKTSDPLKMYLADLYTVAANLAGLPAISLPAGTAPGGNVPLPVGIQLTGNRNSDSKLLSIAEAVEAALS
jgi:aspartyl-tRNA(Asn)/glutamyl-tRNA(Gln) amidotransferase subunit A